MITESNKNYIYIDDIAQVDDVFDNLKSAKVLGVDTETTGLDPHTNKVRLLQIAAEDYPTVIFDCFKILPDALNSIKEILESKLLGLFEKIKP